MIDSLTQVEATVAPPPVAQWPREGSRNRGVEGSRGQEIKRSRSILRVMVRSRSGFFGIFDRTLKELDLDRTMQLCRLVATNLHRCRIYAG